MLVLSRKRDSSIQIGPDIRVTILGIRKSQVKVGVEAPTAMTVWRDELAPKRGSDVPLPDPENERSSSNRPFAILLVEDDPGHAKLICGALSECQLPQSMNVAVAQTAESAMEALRMDECQAWKTSPFDLILLDLYLPRMTGLDLLRRIRTHPLLYLTPVVMLSCTDEDAAAANCLEAGANAFVTKSGDPQSFRTSVARIAGFWSNECRVPRRPVGQAG